MSAPSGFTVSLIGSTSFFSGLLASPPPIGNTTPNTGAFTALTATGSFFSSGVASFVNATTNFGAVSAASGPNLYLINTNGGSGAGASLVFLNNNSAAAQKTAAYINGGLVVATAGAEQGLIDFEVFDGTNNANRIIAMQVNSGGASGTFAPNTDNYWNFGLSGYRWANIYAVTTASTTGFTLTTDNTYFTPSGLSAIPNYGIGAPGSNNVALSAFSNLVVYTGQTERMRVTSAGNVAIGTTTASQTLTVNGTGSFTGALTLSTALTAANGGTGVTNTSAISVTSTSGFTKTLANWTGSSVTPSTINFPSGSLSPNPLIQTAGTSGSPLTSPASVLVAALYSSYGPGASSASVQQGAIVGLAQLYGASTARNANVRAGFFETVDNAGNTGLGVSGNNFVEGVRGHGVPSAGANYTATEGGIFYGAGPAYPSQHMFVFGAEVQVDQQYANAPAPQNLNTQQISAGVNVSIGELASVVTTSASGTGTTATIGYANTSGSPLFPVGSSITVAGVTPSGYNATAVVTAATNNSASYTNATTGAQTVAGTIQQSYFKVDAAFLINPFNPVQAQSGLLIPAGTVTNSAVALGAGAGPTYGLNAGFATGMYAAVLVANNVAAVRAYNAAVTSQLNVLSVNTTNQLVLGNDITAGMIVSIRDETGANPIAREVQYGASNSGGAGFRSLVVPN